MGVDFGTVKILTWFRRNKKRQTSWDSYCLLGKKRKNIQFILTFLTYEETRFDFPNIIEMTFHMDDT